MMRGPRSALSAGLTVVGLCLLTLIWIFGAGIAPATALDCWCKYYKNGICIPADPDCKKEWYGRDPKKGTDAGYATGKDAGKKIDKSLTGYAPGNEGGKNKATGHSPNPAAPSAVTRTRPANSGPAAQIRRPSVPPKKGADTGEASPGTSVGTGAAGAARPHILDTGYGHLAAPGGEAGGYGLYSYAILPSDSARAAVFLSQVFKEIPSIGTTSAKPSQLNILYIPLVADKEAALPAMFQKFSGNAEKLGADYTKSFYDYKMARGLLSHVCNPPDPSILDLCKGDLSRGPYIFTYASPASTIEPVPPPFLFVDLSDVHERAFGEFLAAFQAQVKREDISDRARIGTLRLKVLDLALTAADWIGPVQKALADIVRSPAGGDKK